MNSINIEMEEIFLSIIAIYSRKSRYTDKGESIKNQIDFCKNYCATHFTVDKFIIYEDEGFSGGTTDRPMYNKMLNDAKKKAFDILICYRLDRISRNISDFTHVIDMLQKNNIDFISIKEQFDTSTPMGRAMMYIAGVFAQLERETIAERIKDNMLQLARTGRWLGGITPTGYESKKIPYLDKYGQEKYMYTLYENEKELVIVNKLFEKYLETNSLRKVANWSKSLNLKTTNGNFFNITTIKGILSNMVYVKADDDIYNYCIQKNMDIASDKNEFDSKKGLMVYNKNLERKGKANTLKKTSDWIVAVGIHRGIISGKDFIRVQQILHKNAIKSKRLGTGKLGLINHILVCNNCGNSFRIIYGKKRKDGSRLYYYKCRTKEYNGKDSCNIKNINGELADKKALESINTLKINFNICVDTLISMREKIFDNNYSSPIITLNKNIEKYKNMIDKLTIELTQNNDSPSIKYIIEKIEKLDKKISEERSRLKKIETQYKNISSEFLKELVDCIITNTIYTNLSFSEKKCLIEKIVNKIIWDGETLIFYLKNSS